MKLADTVADLSDGRIYWYNDEDGSFEFAESWTVDHLTRTWKVKCYLKSDEWDWDKEEESLTAEDDGISLDGEDDDGLDWSDDDEEEEGDDDDLEDD